MAKRNFKFHRRCGCKTWAHTVDCKLHLGAANVHRENVNYCSARPKRRGTKRRRAVHRRKGH